MTPSISAFGYTIARLGGATGGLIKFLATPADIEATSDAAALYTGLASLEERGVLKTRLTMSAGGALEITLLPKGRREANDPEVSTATRHWLRFLDARASIVGMGQ